MGGSLTLSDTTKDVVLFAVPSGATTFHIAYQVGSSASVCAGDQGTGTLTIQCRGASASGMNSIFLSEYNAASAGGKHLEANRSPARVPLENERSEIASIEFILRNRNQFLRWFVAVPHS